MDHISIMGFLLLALYLLGSLWYAMECGGRARREKDAKDSAVRLQGIVYVRTVSGALFTMNLLNTPSQGKHISILQKFTILTHLILLFSVC